VQKTVKVIMMIMAMMVMTMRVTGGVGDDREDDDGVTMDL